MVFNSEDLVLIKVLCEEEKVMTVDEWSHSFIGDICECVVCVVSCHGNLFLTCNWKHVIEYVKFPQIFAHKVQTCAKFSCKNFTDVCPVFWILRLYTWGGVFSWTHCITTQFTSTGSISLNTGWSVRISQTAHSWDWQSTKHIPYKLSRWQTTRQNTHGPTKSQSSTQKQPSAAHSQQWIQPELTVLSRKHQWNACFLHIHPSFDILPNTTPP